MWRDDAYLLDILIAIRKIQAFTDGVTEDTFAKMKFCRMRYPSARDYRRGCSWSLGRISGRASGDALASNDWNAQPTYS